MLLSRRSERLGRYIYFLFRASTDAQNPSRASKRSPRYTLPPSETSDPVVPTTSLPFAVARSLRWKCASRLKKPEKLSATSYCSIRYHYHPQFAQLLNYTGRWKNRGLKQRCRPSSPFTRGHWVS